MGVVVAYFVPHFPIATVATVVSVKILLYFPLSLSPVLLDLVTVIQQS